MGKTFTHDIFAFAGSLYKVSLLSEVSEDAAIIFEFLHILLKYDLSLDLHKVLYVL